MRHRATISDTTQDDMMTRSGGSLGYGHNQKPRRPFNDGRSCHASAGAERGCSAGGG